MAKLYAWSNFPTKFGDWGSVTESVKAGDEIKRDDLDCTDEEWDEYIERGLISEQKYPESPSNISPNEYFSSKTTVELAAEAQAQAEAAHQQLLDAREQAQAQQPAQSTQAATKSTTSATGGSSSSSK